ncbi:MAG: DUF2325 domain-containing protein [Gammaproteobacteria bacterium]
MHCAVIGTCFASHELRRIARKSGIRAGKERSDYELHRTLVGEARSRTRAATLMQATLNSKYRDAILESDRLVAPDDLVLYWNRARCTGDIAGAFWSIVTDPRSPAALIEGVYGDVHMLSHLGGVTDRSGLTELERAQKRIVELERRGRQQATRYRKAVQSRDRDVESLRQRIRQLETIVESRTKEVVHLQDRLERETAELLQAQNRELHDRLSALATDLQRAREACDRWQTVAERSTDRCARLEERLAETRAENAALEQMTLALIDSKPVGADKAEPDAPDSQANLCGRCVLYVGGRARQCSHFRSLVERSNGRFVHHDGGREENPRRLGAVLSKADIVMCPLDCVSHDAVNRLKRLCERQEKRLVLIPRASLASFARGLREVGDHV